MKQDKFLKYLKLILESSEAEDDKEIEEYKKTGKIPDGVNPQEFLNKHGDVLMDEETKLKYEKINKFLTQAKSKVKLSFTTKTMKELINYDIDKNIQFHGQDKIHFIDAITRVILNLNNDDRNFFLTTLLTHSPDYIKIAKEIHDFSNENHNKQPHFCQKIEMLFHAKPEYEPTTFNAKKFDIEEEKKNEKFIGGLKYFANDQSILSNKTMKTIVDSLIENLHIKIDFDNEASDLNSAMFNDGELFNIVDNYFNFDQIERLFNRTKIERIIGKVLESENKTISSPKDQKMIENFIEQIAMTDDVDSVNDADYMKSFFELSRAMVFKK